MSWPIPNPLVPRLAGGPESTNSHDMTKMRAIFLPAIDRTVSLGAYLQAIRIAKANPDLEFKTGLTTWWPTTGSEIVKQFRESVHDRINQAVPYLQRGQP
jgi:hypothetical protein